MKPSPTAQPIVWPPPWRPTGDWQMSSAGAKITKSSSAERFRRRMIVCRFQWATARETVRACESLKSGLISYGTTPSGQRLLSPDIA